MVIKGKLHSGGQHLLDASVDIDLFAKKAQKITIITRLVKNTIPKGCNVTGSLEINSAGQQLKVDLKQHFIVTPSEIDIGSTLSYTDQHQKPKHLTGHFAVTGRKVHLHVHALNKDLLKSDTAIDIGKKEQKFDTEFVLLDNSPVVLSLHLQDMNSFKYASYQKDKPDTKLAVNGQVIIGQVAEVHADLYKDGQKKPLFSVGIYLDSKRFLKPNFEYSKDNVAFTLDLYRELLAKRNEQLKTVVKEITSEAITEVNDLFQHLKKAQPNFKPVLDYYQAELEKLKQELNADTTITEIQATLNKIFGGLISVITKTISQLTERMAELTKQFNEITEKITEAIKVIVPRIKESAEKILHAAIEIVDAAAKLGTTYVKAILDILNEHQKEIKELLTAVTSLAHDIVEIILKGFSQVQKEVDSAIKLTVQQIQALPIFDFIKEKYSEISNFQVPEAVFVPIEEAFVQLKKILPTEELREFFTVTYNYIIKHIKRQNVDNAIEIQNIYTHAVDALQSIIQLLQRHGSVDQLYGLFGTSFHGDFGYFKHLPGFPILRVSLFNILRNHELPTIAEIYHTYRPTLYASDIIPPFSKTGIVVEGGHFFTFDGRHLTLAGTCDYVLARDTRDGNFTIIGSFNNGKLISITLTAPGESITVKSNGNVSLFI